MISRARGISLKYQIEELLRSELESLNHGDQIPSEEELAERFSVSRGTVREAILELMNEGIVYRIQGKGTFKSGKALYNSGYKITSLTEQLIQNGFKPGIRDIRVSDGHPSERIRSLLQVDEKENLWEISRVRLADDSPLCYNTAYLRKSLIPILQVSDLEMSLLDMVTNKFGLRVIRSESYCSAIAATKFLSEVLLVKIKSPILHLEHISYGVEEKPVFVDISDSAGGREFLRFEQRG